jgi:prepilin-type N-terminal cleavage/methylation domain-containing protein
MKSPNMKTPISNRYARGSRTKGFTLIEFLVAMIVFTVVTGAVFSLFRKDDPLFNQQQSVSGMNISLQNSITQLQLDGVNAGSGYYAGMNIPNFPVGITIVENQNAAGAVTPPAVGDCGDNATFLYHADCFDTLNIITTDPLALPQHLDGPAPTHCADMTTGTMILLPPPGLTAGQIATWATTTAGYYAKGDTLLLLKSDGSQMTTVNLVSNVAPAVASATTVTISYTATTAAGVNPLDALQLTTHSGGTSDNPHTQIGSSFCNGDWLLRLQPIVYKVDDTNPANPKLTRTVGTAPADVIAEQIVGFKVGASIANPTNTTDGIYVYDASHFGVGCGPVGPGCPVAGFDFSVIRSIRVAVIGRTPPNAGSAGKFVNTYDNGPYQIQGLSVVINPRNLSMTDQ